MKNKDWLQYRAALEYLKERMERREFLGLKCRVWLAYPSFD